LREVGQKDAAVASFRRAIELMPYFAEAHNNIGILYFSQGNRIEAVAHYRQAVSIAPNYAEAFNNLGAALQEQTLHAEAADAYRSALRVRPRYAQAAFNLGNLIFEQAPQEAISALKQAVTISPGFYEAWLLLGKLFNEQGDLAQASYCYGRCIEIKPSPGITVRNALMLPPIMGTQAEVLQSRAAFIDNLDRLVDDRVRLTDPFQESCNANFYLAYQGFNDREVQVRVAQFYEQACPSLLYVAPHCGQPRDIGRKPRIGFLSKYIYKHSVSLSYSRIVEYMAGQGEFDVTLISNSAHQDLAVHQAYPNFKGTHVQLPLDLEVSRTQVAALELDILLYLDVGMDSFSYFLAFSRLARAQCVTGGHPVTTGISHIDYFLSSDLAEPELANSHYSEKLVRLPLGFFYFERPTLPIAYKTRLELGLPHEGRVYLCPMTLQKLHPDFDEAMARILKLDPEGHIVLFADRSNGSWSSLLGQRLDQTIPADVRHRVVFLPWVNDPLDFISMNAQADVVLDPFHFGIGSTAIMTSSVGTPFITKSGEFMRGRVGLFYAKIMDVMECVAQDVEDYAQKAVAIASDRVLRESIRIKILKNNGALFDNRQAIDEGLEFFRSIAYAAVNAMKQK
jgi:predicted O-linked N-acetylglucosamine transferase (SPINDLY family)